MTSTDLDLGPKDTRRRPQRISNHKAAALIAATMLIGAACPVTASGQSKASELFGLARHPRHDLAVGYEVDVSWPRRPLRFAWGEVSGVALDRHGRIWSLNRGEVPVQVFDREGNLLQAWGEGRFRRPHQIEIDRAGHVWIVDAGGHTVTKFSPDGRPLLTLGTPDEAGEDEAHFDEPTDVAIAPDGDIYVSDGYGNNRVVHFDAAGRFLGSWGGQGPEPGRFSLPHAIALDSRGRVYVADRNNARVQVFDRGGTFLAEWRNLLVPWDIAITADDSVYVCGSSPMRWGKLALPGLVLGVPPKDQLVMRLDTDGRVRELWTFPLGRDRAGELEWVHGLAVDDRGDLYLGDIQGKRLQRFARLPARPSSQSSSPAPR